MAGEVIMARQSSRFFPKVVRESSATREEIITYDDKRSAFNAPFEQVKVPEGITPLKGAEIFVHALAAVGVDVLFGYPGGAILEVFDVLCKAGIKCIRTEHEQGAAHGAEGFARATGKVGVCLSTSGPGATNLVTGIADAFSDSVPIVAITGQVPQHLLGKMAFQEVAIVDICKPITKSQFQIKRVIDIPDIVREAFHLAVSGRPGPVLIDFPKDVQQQYAVDADSNYIPPSLEEPMPSAPAQTLNGAVLDQVVNLIRHAKRPMLYCGGGVISANASKQLVEFMEKTGIPAVTTIMGVGAVPPDHRLCFDVLGMHGAKYANDAVNEADLLLAFGVRFDDRVTGKLSEFARHARIVHIDIDPMEINKNKAVDISIVCDLSIVLRSLLGRVETCDCAAWVETLTQWKQQWPFPVPCCDQVIKPQSAIALLNEMVAGQAIVITGVGQHQMWAMQLYRPRQPRCFISSSGLGTMGFGLPAAMGAQVGCPERLVINIDGDGSFNMTAHELSTLHRYHLPVKNVIINNQYLGMVRQWQDLIYKGHRAESHLADPNKTEWANADGTAVYPDFVTLARAYGVEGDRVSEPEKLRAAFEAMFACDGPYVLDVIVDPEEDVYPMIPAGATNRDIILAKPAGAPRRHARPTPADR
jgi:acetolactate synthase I/II/III large subunit